MAQVLKIYDSNEVEVRILVNYSYCIYSYNQTPEMTVKCFKNETYSKIPEFASFYQRLKFSKQKAMVLAQVHRLKFIYFLYEERKDPFPENLIYDDLIVEKCFKNDNRERILQDFPKTWPMDMKQEEEVLLVSNLVYLTMQDQFIRIYHSLARLFRDFLENKPPGKDTLECYENLVKSDSAEV
jgi:hypothetical protein